MSAHHVSAHQTRRQALMLIASGVATGLATGAAATAKTAAGADERPTIVVAHDPSCGCCHKWILHIQENGFAVKVNDLANHRALKAQLGVPRELAGCHTGTIEGYVVEGHVPASAIKRLLAEKPAGRGLAVAGMPVGSPGMEGGEPEIYDIILFGDGPQQTFDRYREDKPV